MKIREFSIIHYGPLPNTGKIKLHNFNLFWGKNEEGKTLTIDALVKLLLGRNIRDFEHIDRVEEDPEGYIIIEDDKGKEIKLSERENLTKFVDLTPSECCNIFIVRNSNLSIAHDITQESEFYTNITDRLTGLRTGEISEIKKNLREIGKITPTGVFRDIGDEKLKTRVENAKDLIKKIDSLDREIKEKRFDKLEEESVNLREEIERIEQEIKSLEDARKREKYEKGEKALNNLKESLEKLKGLEIYNEEDKQIWRDCEKEIKEYTGEKEETYTELKKIEEELDRISEKLCEAKRDFEVLDNRKRKVDDEIKPELKNYEMGVGKIKSDEIKNRFYIIVLIISAVPLSISILGLLINPLRIFYVLLAAFLVSTIIFAVLGFSFTQRKAHFGAVFERIKLTASKFEISAENSEEIYSNIQKFDEKHQTKQSELQKIEWEERNLREKIKKLRDETIPSIGNKIRNSEKKIDEIKRKSKEENIEEYVKKLELKQKLEKSIEEQKSILKSHFEENGKKLEENILYWEDEIGKLKGYKDEAKDIKYSEAKASELKEEKQKSKNKLGEINDRMVSLQKEMEEVQQKANKILRLEEEYLYCNTSVDLKVVKDNLQRFIDENENNKANVLENIKIFEEIESEEKEKISKLFGKESPISKYFNEITDGLYEEVTFNQEIGKIEVKRKDGVILEAEKLSGGAYDQLYFSIRLALGEKLLKGKRGFFIMDDPFIKADPDRLKKQVEMLKKISELGWQVIYFSAKKEIKDILEEDIRRRTINYMELQGILS